jgi:hypothetical protein
MNDLFSLAVAKFPLSRVPALIAEVKKGKDEVYLRATEDAKVYYLEFVSAGESVEVMLAAEREYDIVLIDQDLDDAGYSIIDSLSIVQRAYQCRQLPLTEPEVSLRQDAQDLLSSVFPKGNEIFRYGHLAQWSEVKTLLQRSENPENAKKIARLGLGHYFIRLERCHQVLGGLLGIQGEPGAEVSTVVRFEEALSQLISVVVLRYSKDTDEHRRMRELLVGPIKRHVEAYREEQRRKQAKLAAQLAKQTEPEPAPHQESGV